MTAHSVDPSLQTHVCFLRPCISEVLNPVDTYCHSDAPPPKADKTSIIPLSTPKRKRLPLERHDADLLGIEGGGGQLSDEQQSVVGGPFLKLTDFSSDFHDRMALIICDATY